MPKFTGTVIELQSVTCRYEVEADDIYEATLKMEQGDTVSEMTIKTNDVVHRTVGVPQEML